MPLDAMAQQAPDWLEDVCSRQETRSFHIVPVLLYSTLLRMFAITHLGIDKRQQISIIKQILNCLRRYVATLGSEERSMDVGIRLPDADLNKLQRFCRTEIQILEQSLENHYS